MARSPVLPGVQAWAEPARSTEQSASLEAGKEPVQKVHPVVFEAEKPMTASKCVLPLKLWFPSVFKLVPQLLFLGCSVQGTLRNCLLGQHYQLGVKWRNRMLLFAGRITFFYFS